MRKSFRVVVLAAAIYVTAAPTYAAPMGTNPHPSAALSLSAVVSAILSALGL
jgi:hypothetical protein